MSSNASGQVGETGTMGETTGTGAAEGAGVGAGIGAALGGVGGLLVGLGALVIPGIGPVIAAGPLAAALGGVAGAGAGAIAGGAAGGLLGALTDMGVHEEQAQYYAEGVRRGGTLLTVRTEDDMASRAVDVMNRHNPIDVRHRANQWREAGWQGFDVNAQPYVDRGIDRERQLDQDKLRPDITPDEDIMGRDREMGPSGTMGTRDVGTTDTRDIGRQTDMPEGRGFPSAPTDAGDVGRGAMGAMGSVETMGKMGTHTFDRYDTDFRDHFDQMYANRGYTYNDYVPAYRYGYDLAINERYSGRDWSEFEMEAQRDWQQRHPDSAWDDFKDAIRHGWERVRNAFR
jgi:hypothetical protein